ncbi:MAG: molybdopterin-dependent oxidoreductase [Ardenticatenia bacterium]|nr:molybdopterin-dependent oxidoreductase [Ardenticatenia bacterium]
MTTSFHWIGHRTPLRDGRSKVTGVVEYAPDVKVRGMLHARLVTSPYAHARLRGIESSRALAVPGVVAVLTADDLPDIPPRHRHTLLLARDRVIFAGQPVALVLATDEAAAEDGAERVVVEYEPLPAAVTADEALAPDAPLVWPEGLPGETGEAAAHGADVGGEEETSSRSNVSNRVHFSRGNIEEGFRNAEVIVEHTFTTPMVHQGYVEPHAVVVQPDPLTGGVTVWSSTQAPFYVREQVADVLGVPESDVRVVATPVGGGFGGKFLLYEPLIALAARAIGRPVRFVMTRLEEMIAANPAAASRIHLRLGARRDGTLTALEAELTFDAGCFPSAPVGIAAVLVGSLYRIPHVEIRGVEVLTFKPSTGAYRAPGAPQAAFAMESALDELAHRLNVDPLELRLRHACRAGDPMIHGKPWPSMGMADVLETLRHHPAWQERHKARQAGRGVGVAIGGWPGGTEPAAAACTSTGMEPFTSTWAPWT